MEISKYRTAYNRAKDLLEYAEDRKLMDDHEGEYMARLKADGIMEAIILEAEREESKPTIIKPLISSTGVIYGSIEYVPDAKQGRQIEQALKRDSLKKSTAAIKDTTAK